MILHSRPPMTVKLLSSFCISTLKVLEMQNCMKNSKLLVIKKCYFYTPVTVSHVLLLWLQLCFSMFRAVGLWEGLYPTMWKHWVLSNNTLEESRAFWSELGHLESLHPDTNLQFDNEYNWNSSCSFCLQLEASTSHKWSTHSPWMQ